MPRLRALTFSALIALFGLALPAGAAPIVFDFEDGLQGWTLGGDVVRVETNRLGGDWALVGNGFSIWWPSISKLISLTEFTAISMDVHFSTVTAGGGLWFRLVGPDFATREMPFEVIEEGETSQLFADLSPWKGSRATGVFISWVKVGNPTVRAFALIDNITFHAVSEPASAVLLGLGLVGLAALRN
jgi:hypothetical protein